MYAAICIAATLTVRGCDHASLLVRENDRYVTVGASDQLARHIDELERRAGDGPASTRSRRRRRRSTPT